MAGLVRKIHIKANPEVVGNYVVDPISYIQWGRTDAILDRRLAGTYRALLGGSHQSAGEFLEVVPSERLESGIGWAEPDHPISAASIVGEMPGQKVKHRREVPHP
jgi:uncharacterized protein YndB with AHSA1/START domain